MPSTVPLETFVLTLLVPRAISDSDVSSLLKRIRKRPFRKRLQKALRRELGRLPGPVTATIRPTR